MKAQQIIRQLKAQANPKNVEGMARCGINPRNTLGVNILFLRQMAKQLGKQHDLALDLWASEIHEARLLAAFIDEAGKVTAGQMEAWVKAFDSWDICDQVCSNLFDKTPLAYGKAKAWTSRTHEFTKRAGYVLMACLAVHDKAAPDSKLMPFFPLIIQGADDDRNFVKKAVNWALRQLGKRNRSLNKVAIKTAREIAKLPATSAKWIAADALRELLARSNSL